MNIIGYSNSFNPGRKRSNIRGYTFLAGHVEKRRDSSFRIQKKIQRKSTTFQRICRFNVRISCPVKKEEEEGQERNVTTVKRFCSRADSAQKGRDAAYIKRRNQAVPVRRDFLRWM